MKITVFGATGATGRLVVDKALHRGHHVTAFVRNAARLPIDHPRLDVIEGRLEHLGDVECALLGRDAVVCTLGATLMNKDQVRTWGTERIVKAMLNTHVQRLVCLSSFGAGESREHLPPLYRYALAPLLFRHVLADHTRQEDIIKRSGLQWTFVRPVNLTDDPAAGHYIIGTTKPEQQLSMKISREDVANFIVQELNDEKYVNKAPFMSYGASQSDRTLSVSKNTQTC